jgi:hypothetical protein
MLFLCDKSLHLWLIIYLFSTGSLFPLFSGSPFDLLLRFQHGDVWLLVPVASSAFAWRILPSQLLLPGFSLPDASVAASVCMSR